MKSLEFQEEFDTLVHMGMSDKEARDFIFKLAMKGAEIGKPIIKGMIKEGVLV